MNNNNDHIEELVDRFVTNTATPEETDQLFDAIAENPELGNSLTTASRLQAEFDRDLAMIDVPPGIYESIVAAAPFTSIPVGTAVASSATTATSALSATTIAVSAISGLIAISMAVIMAVTLFTDNNAATETAHSVITGATDIQQSAPTRQVAPAESVTSNTNTVQHGQQVVSSFNGAPTRSEPTPPSEVVELSEQPLMIMAANVLPVDSALHNSNTELTTQPFTTHSLTPQPFTPQPYTTSFFIRVQQRPLTSTSTDQTASSISNLGLEASTTVARDLLVGLGVYHDNFPMRVVEANGDTTSTEDLYWGGAHVRWQPEVSLPFDLGLFAQLTLGGSSRGIVTQPSLGITKAIGPVDLGLGIDCSSFAFQNNGVWNMTLQPGLRATLGFRIE